MDSPMLFLTFLNTKKDTFIYDTDSLFAAAMTDATSFFTEKGIWYPKLDFISKREKGNVKRECDSCLSKRT